MYLSVPSNAVRTLPLVGLIVLCFALASCSAEPAGGSADDSIAADEAQAQDLASRSTDKSASSRKDEADLQAQVDPENADEQAIDPRAPSKDGSLSAANSADVGDSGAPPVSAPDPKAGPVVDDIWKPASTPRGGVSWKTLESTSETTRLDSEGYIISKPNFSSAVKKLDGKRIKVAGWMMPIDNGAKQKRFVLLGYPPGCPFHFHAAPMQFIEVFADTPFPTNETMVHVVSGVLELTGYDESGVFYRLRKAKPA